MKTEKRVKWICPRCEDVRLGLHRPRLDDSKRYCLPCSDKTGRLTKRVKLSAWRKWNAANKRAKEIIAREMPTSDSSVATINRAAARVARRLISLDDE